MRSMNRKHLNQVPRSKGIQKEDPVVDRLVKYKNKGSWNISKIDAQRIMKSYGIKHDPSRSYKKAINRTGIYINYNQSSDRYQLTKIK
jgi:hypothetical protein